MIILIEYVLAGLRKVKHQIHSGVLCVIQVISVVLMEDWRNVKKHFDRPKHVQCMKDAFGSTPFVTSSHSSSSFSSSTNDGSVYISTLLTSVNEAGTPFVSIQNDQRSLTHEDSKCS